MKLASEDLIELSKGIPNTTKDLRFLGNRIKKFDPAVFKQLHNLQTLDLVDNSIRHLPNNLSYWLPRLQKIYLDDNYIEDIPLLQGYENITVLSLNWNRIKIIRDNTFANAINLKELYLGDNSITSYNAVTNLRNLHTLVLKGNSIETLLPKHFENLKNLIFVDLSHNKLITLPNDLFSKLSLLEKLYLNNNRIKMVNRYTLGNLQNVISLDMEMNMIEFIDSKAFCRLKHLQVLQLSNNRLRYTNKTVFQNLRNLEYIYLSHNRLEIIQKGLLFGLTSLKYISLFSNEINTIEDGSLEGLRNDSTVFLSKNNISYLSTRQFDGFYGTVKIYDNPIKCSCLLWEFTKRTKCHILGECNSSPLKWKHIHINNLSQTFNPCLNNGLCILRIKSDLMCKCTEQYQGRYCQLKKYDNNKENDKISLWIIIGICGAVLTIISLICAVRFHRKRTRSQQIIMGDDDSDLLVAMD